MLKFIRRSLAVIGLLIFGAVFLAPAGSVFAADVVTTDSNSLAQIKMSPVFWALLTSLVVPAITGFLTGLKTSGLKKNLITLALSAITSIVGAVAFVGGSYVLTKETVITTLFAWAIANLSYSRLFKPAGITSSVIEVNGVEQPGKLATVGVK